MQLVKGKWWTQTTLESGNDGTTHFRGFLGDYRVTVKLADGRSTDESFTLKKAKDNRWCVKLEVP